MDYSIFYRKARDPSRVAIELPRYDIFISAFNSSDRISSVFDGVRAKRKYWLIQPEYGFRSLEFPTTGELVAPDELDEQIQIEKLLSKIGAVQRKNLCVDITGFMRHSLVFLIAKLQSLGVHCFTALYSEPRAYVKQEQTLFSTSTSGTVRSIRGMHGVHDQNLVDHVVIGIGYDHRLISEVANSKDSAAAVPLFAFPSLSPDMYQQSVMRAADCGELALSSNWIVNRRFAPANDPFATAQVVSAVIQDIDRTNKGSNVYLSPLSTKAQALGFVLYWLREGKSRGAVSMLMPECLSYERETSTGLRRFWEYRIEL